MRANSSTTLTFALINALFMVGGAGMAAVTLYPVYSSSTFIIVATASVLAGALIALLCARLGWTVWAAAGLALAAYVGIGLGLAIPGVRAGDTPILNALGALARAPIAGWKDVVTLPLPLGEFGATLLPAVLLLLVGTLASVWLSLARRWWGTAAVVTVWMVATAVLLGPAVRATPLRWAPYGVYVNREFLVGLATFALLLAWMGWRGAYVRRRALAQSTSGARLATTHRVRAFGSIAAATVMVGVAVVVAGLIAGPVAAETPREVARSVIEPRVVINSTVTPLAGYRTYFTEDSFESVLFTVHVTEGQVSRVRLATLPYFDGDAFTAATDEGGEAPFERVPSRIAAPEGTAKTTATIDIGSLGGVWVPLVGQLGSITFHGEHSGELLDSFFYQQQMATGIVTTQGGLRAGDSYEVQGYVPVKELPLTAVGSAPGGDVIDSSRLPASLTDWVTRQGVSRDGAGLAELVQRLRERGYLSHSLEDDPEATWWQSSLGQYEFASSAAGSSYDRIDRLFTELNEREAEVADNPDASLVAAVGDDEQFAAAVALVAADLGFPSRVVLGARLADTDDSGWSVPACVDGQCRGENIAAWVEVQSMNGTWVPIDVTPQHQSPPSPDVTQERDPKFASDLDPKRAEPIAPPSSQRGSAAESDPPVPDTTSVWDSLGPVLRVVGISLLGIMVLLGPFVAILVWKGVRRRRRRAGPPTEAIHHGWDEYLDNAVDAGLEPLPRATRLETARTYRSLNGVRLAQLTDRTTFGTGTAVAEEAEEFWRLIAAERAAWMADRGFWSRMRMRLSLRSLWHSVAQQAPDSAPSTAPTASREVG